MERKNPKVKKTNKRKLMLLIKCAMVKNSRVIKEQETSGLLKTFRVKFLYKVIFCLKIMNEMLNNFLLAGENLNLKCI